MNDLLPLYPHCNPFDTGFMSKDGHEIYLTRQQMANEVPIKASVVHVAMDDNDRAKAVNRTP